MPKKYEKRDDLDEGLTQTIFQARKCFSEGFFYTANKLYGIKFIKRTDIPVYNEEVTAYEVQEANGKHIGILYYDFHPRNGKSNGAWCTTFRDQMYQNGKLVTPVVSIVWEFYASNWRHTSIVRFR